MKEDLKVAANGVGATKTVQAETLLRHEMPLP
jgi:hypothetical protein